MCDNDKNLLKKKKDLYCKIFIHFMKNYNFKYNFIKEIGLIDFFEINTLDRK